MKATILIHLCGMLFSGCYVRMVEGSDSPLAKYVGREAEVTNKVVIYDRGVFGRLGIPAGAWPISDDEEVKMTLEPGATIEVIGVASRRIGSGKHYYLACRYRNGEEEVTFDYPADGKLIGAEYILWR